MKEYDFSKIDFSLLEIIEGLARAYAVLLRNAERQTAQEECTMQVKVLELPAPSSQKSIREPIYRQECMF